MIPVESRIAPDCTMFGDDDGVFMSNFPPMHMNGTTFVPTGNVTIADNTLVNEDSGDEIHCISIMLWLRRAGLHHSMTPDGARAVAAALIRAADVVDARVAGQAAAAIEKARSGGGCS